MNEAILTQIKSLKKLKMKIILGLKSKRLSNIDRFEAAKLKTEITRKKAAGLKFIKKTIFIIFCPQFLSENLVLTSPKLLDGLTSNFQQLCIY